MPYPQRCSLVQALLLLGQAAGGLREADAPERLGPDPIRFMKRAFTIALRRLEPELREVVVEVARFLTRLVCVEASVLP